MHYVIERARKAAGISGMKKNYPDDNKQRGCGFWAAFLGSISRDLGELDRELREKDARIVDLEHELNDVRKRAAENGVQLIAQQEEKSVEWKTKATKMLVG